MRDLIYGQEGKEWKLLLSLLLPSFLSPPCPFRVSFLGNWARALLYVHVHTFIEVSTDFAAGQGT